MNTLLLAGALGLVIDCSHIGSVTVDEQWQLEVCNKLQAQYMDVQLTAIKITNRPLDAGSQLDKVMIGDVFAGRMKVGISAEREGKQIKREYLFSVKAMQEVLIATRRVYKGDSLKDGDITKRKMNIAPFIGVKMFMASQSTHLSLKKTVGKNEILFADYFERVKLIASQQSIDVLIVSGNLSIKTQGIAIDSAEQVGDEIRIKVIETGAIVKGVVKIQENVYVEI